jgi:CheY-like chemotaxis protein
MSSTPNPSLIDVHERASEVVARPVRALPRLPTTRRPPSTRRVSEMNTAVLCVDADDADRDRTVETLSSAGLAPTGVASVAAAEEALASTVFDCVVTAYRLPDGTGLDVVSTARTVHPDAGCVLFTDVPFDEIDTRETADAVVDHLQKTDADYDYLPDLVTSITTARTHTAYPLPDDEAERLAALGTYDVEGLATTDTFDRLTELASLHFDARFAFVGLVDAHEERFLSCYGADWESIPREQTVCTYAILEDEVTVIEDLQRDPIFETNDLLAELGLRSYAGAKLTAPNGEAVGMFCVLDDEPRTYSDDEREALRLYAAEASEQLELRSRLAVEGVEQ